jgi:hypothetical protein
MNEDRVPAVVESLIRTVAGGSGEDREERASTFARGLALGALVGAAIAGSTIWQRKVARDHARAAALEAERETATPAAGTPTPATGTATPAAGTATPAVIRESAED